VILKNNHFSSIFSIKMIDYSRMNRAAILVVLLVLLFFLLMVILYSLPQPLPKAAPTEPKKFSPSIAQRVPRKNDKNLNDAICYNPDDIKMSPAQVSIQPDETKGPFVPSEDRIVPTHASYSNKFNDVIGNEMSGIVGEGVREVNIPSDWYMSRELPSYFDGEYWPRGSILPDFIYKGSDPGYREYRKQDWPSWFSVLRGA
jgi:hypothetical protein